jgi:phosphatidylinositol glycan class O
VLQGFQSLKKYERVFVFVIDALRSDFVIYKDGATCFDEQMNCFAYMQKLLLENSSQCSLYKFRSEPPTVTAQRLKALTTGTLPTFIDFRLNLDSTVITEDNIIDHLIRKDGEESGKNHSFLIYGDDTWKSLFPSQFSEYHVFDSFNTKDLNTVDDGIYSHLWGTTAAANEDVGEEEGSGSDGNCTSRIIRSGNWKVLITHFLGVDHIGHTYHAFHPQMSDRLKRMDEILEKIVSCLPEDALLLVFGDHGMTREGEHGGASVDEIDSAIFVYSHRKLFMDNTMSEINIDLDDSMRKHLPSRHKTALEYPKTVYQVDIVPTLSLLLGVPIPFSSIGKIIPEMFMLQEDGRDELLLALFVNAIQIWKYLVSYSGITTNFNDHDNYVPTISQLKDIAEAVHRTSFRISRSDAPGLTNAATLLSNAVKSHLYLLQSTNLSDTMSVSRDFVISEYFQFFSYIQEFARYIICL